LKTVFGVKNVATQGVDYYGDIGGNYYPGGAPPWAIYDSKSCLFLSYLVSASSGQIASYAMLFGDLVLMDAEG